MATSLKSLEVRQIEARGRARSLGVKVQVVRERREYVTRSQSQPGVVYRISLHGKRLGLRL